MGQVREGLIVGECAPIRRVKHSIDDGEPWKNSEASYEGQQHRDALVQR